MTQRKQRIEHGLRDVLTEMIAREVRDPRVRAATLLTVTRVELNVDLSVATVYVSIDSGPASSPPAKPAAPLPRDSVRSSTIGGDAVATRALAGLNKAAGFLRGPVARELNLMRAPELRFVADPSIDMSEKLAAIIRDDEERARAAGRGADEPGRTENDDLVRALEQGQHQGPADREEPA